MTDVTETPYAADLDAEERGWYEIVSLVRRCTLEERMAPGYYGDPDFTRVPGDVLLSAPYAEARRKLIDPEHADRA